jgi:ribosome-associated protein
MDIRKLQRVIVDGLEDLKAQHIAVFNTEHLSSLFERVIIASGTSNRQTRALASSVRDAVKEAGHPAPRLEGEANGEWIIVDCGAAVVHVMQPTIRDYYHLEEIWGDKPVHMKLASVQTRLVKAAADDGPAGKPTAKRTAARKAADIDGAARTPSKATLAKATPNKAAPKKAPVRKTGGDAAKPARRPAAKKAAPASGRLVTRVVGVKRAPAAKKAPAKRGPATAKAPARETSRKA